MRKRLFRIGTTIGSVLVLLGVLLGSTIISHPQTVASGHCDCAIILGAAVDGATPSPVFQSRIDHAVTLFKTGIVSHLLFTGGSSDGNEMSESEAGKHSAMAQGIPASAIFTENRSRTTMQNLAEAQKVMRQQRFRTAVIVSDPFHLYRASRMAADMQIAAITSATPTTRYVTLKTQAPFLFREIYFTIHYSLFGE
ncbi:MAG: YdcF family protein [Verrucomicrobiota bacterium]